MRDVEPVHHYPAKQREFRQGRLKPLEMVAEFQSIEGHGLKHPATGGRARKIRIVIRIDFYRLEAHLRMFFEIIDGLRPACQECLAKIGAIGLGHGRSEIGFRLRQIIGQSCRLHLMVDGDPDHAIRPGGGASDMFRFFDEKNFQALRGGDCGCGHAPGPGARDDDVIRLGREHR